MITNSRSQCLEVTSISESVQKRSCRFSAFHTVIVGPTVFLVLLCCLSFCFLACICQTLLFLFLLVVLRSPVDGGISSSMFVVFTLHCFVFFMYYDGCQTISGTLLPASAMVLAPCCSGSSIKLYFHLAHLESGCFKPF